MSLIRNASGTPLGTVSQKFLETADQLEPSQTTVVHYNEHGVCDAKSAHATHVRAGSKESFVIKVYHGGMWNNKPYHPTRDIGNAHSLEFKDVPRSVFDAYVYFLNAKRNQNSHYERVLDFYASKS